MNALKCLFYAILLIKFSLVISYNVKAHFPVSRESYFPRIRMTETLPKMEEFTFCSWIKPYLLNGLNPIVSYASSNNHNELLLSLITSGNNTKIEVNYGGAVLHASCSRIFWETERWYHICINLFPTSGTISFYVNGIICQRFKNYAEFAKRHIPSGGVLIIGQEQDDVNSKFDANQSWFGDIADLQIWSEYLNEDQIKEAGKCNGRRKQGNVFAWMKTKISVSDEVTFSETELCKL